MRDFAVARADGRVDLTTADEALKTYEVDELGLDKVDRAILEAVVLKFGGGPVGLSTLAIAVGEDPETVEDAYEPFLLQIGLLQRTPRGPHGHRHGLQASRSDPWRSGPASLDRPLPWAPRPRTFSYELPAEAIAQQPLEPRDASRLLDADDLIDHTFSELPSLLSPGRRRGRQPLASAGRPARWAPKSGEAAGSKPSCFAL